MVNICCAYHNNIDVFQVLFIIYCIMACKILEKDNFESDFEIRIIDSLKGRGLFAKRNFKEGEKIFEEKPIVSCQFLWNQTYGYLACDFCMRPLESTEENVRRLTHNPELSLPYPDLCDFKNPFIECSFCGVSYCSESCREEAWNKYHEILCIRSFSQDMNHPLIVLQEEWKHIHYPPETASIMLLARIFAAVRQSRDQESTIKNFLQFCHRTVNEEESIVHKLLGEEFSTQLEKLRILMEKALGGPDIQHWLTPEGFQSLFALIGTNGQGIGTSPLSQWVKSCDNLEDISEDERTSLDAFIDNLYEKLEEEAGRFLNNEGSGLYQLQSSCNHSCLPNATPTFPYNNCQLVLEAVCDIKEGEEIYISYLDECSLNRSRHSRQKILRENYIFSCQCKKCESEKGDPDETSDEDMEDSDEMEPQT